MRGQGLTTLVEVAEGEVRLKCGGLALTQRAWLRIVMHALQV